MWMLRGRRRTARPRGRQGTPAATTRPCCMITATVGDAEDGTGELLDHQDRHALAGDAGHDVVELADDERGQAHRQLVEEQQAGVGGQAAGHGEHLLLAARQRAGQLVDRAPRAGGSGRRPAARRRPRRTPRVGGHAQVLADGEVAEHAAALGDGAHAEAGQRVGLGAVDVAAGDVDAAGGRRHLAGGHLQRGGLAGAVRAEQRDDRARRHREVDPVQHLDAAVARPGRLRSSSSGRAVAAHRSGGRSSASAVTGSAPR